MAKPLVVRFSRAGSMRMVAQSVAAGLERAGHEVDLHDLTAGTPPSPTGNIHFDAGGRPVCGRAGIVSTCCDLRCRVEAIQSPMRWRCFAPLLSALERTLLSWLPHARVTLEGGEVKRASGDT